MNKKMFIVSLLVFGLGMGVSAMAMATTPSPSSVIRPGITPVMAQCIAACEANGGKAAVCWAVCVTGK